MAGKPADPTRPLAFPPPPDRADAPEVLIMTDTGTRAQQRTAADEDVAKRLLESAATLSYDPAVEVDWDAPLPEDLYGLNPEWSTLYGTPLWDEMTSGQKVALTRHEVGSIMSTGIWFEMILQQMVLRDQYVKNPVDPQFRFALTEIADECRHSIMFARACEKMGVPAYLPARSAIELARGFKTLATAEVAYGGILVAEEILDVMQRDWMRGEDVLPIVRTTSRIHVVEESRHMKFARQQMRERLRGSGPAHAAGEQRGRRDGRGGHHHEHGEQGRVRGGGPGHPARGGRGQRQRTPQVDDALQLGPSHGFPVRGRSPDTPRHVHLQARPHALTGCRHRTELLPPP